MATFQIELTKKLENKNMTTWVSFTDTWKAFVREDIFPKATDRYAFGCDRLHVIRKDELIPMEVTWCTENREAKREAVSVDEIPSTLLEKWRAFERQLTSADAEGRIDYRIGSYPDYVQDHPEAIWAGH
jgi:hypothetical protein